MGVGMGELPEATLGTYSGGSLELVFTVSGARR